MTSVGEEYPKEQARCREVLVEYLEAGRAGVFGAVLIKQTLREADEAAVSGDLPRMLVAFQKMRDIK